MDVASPPGPSLLLCVDEDWPADELPVEEVKRQLGVEHIFVFRGARSARVTNPGDAAQIAAAAELLQQHRRGLLGSPVHDPDYEGIVRLVHSSLTANV